MHACIVRLELLVDTNGLVPLEYQEAMRGHKDTLRRLDAALRAHSSGSGSAPGGGWTAEQAQAARELLQAAHQAYRDTCARVAALPVEERRELVGLVKAELDSYDKVNRVIVEVPTQLNYAECDDIEEEGNVCECVAADGGGVDVGMGG